MKKPTEEEFNTSQAFQRCTISVQFPLEVPQDNICNSDYQDGIKHNMRAARTLTMPRKRERKAEGKKDTSLLSVLLEKTAKAIQEGKTKTDLQE